LSDGTVAWASDGSGSPFRRSRHALRGVRALALSRVHCSVVACAVLRLSAMSERLVFPAQIAPQQAGHQDRPSPARAKTAGMIVRVTAASRSPGLAPLLVHES
jgi:hypothetical protein